MGKMILADRMDGAAKIKPAKARPRPEVGASSARANSHNQHCIAKRIEAIAFALGDLVRVQRSIRARRTR